MFFRKKKFLPETVGLESCSLCNLNCRDCYMRKYNFCGVGAGYLKLEDFVSFLDKNPFVKNVELANNGEVFLNPHLLDMFKIAFERGVNIYCNTVNFNKVSDEIIEAIVKYKIKMLTVAVDGACQETYSKYRVGGNFDKVMDNIKKINEYKKKYNSILPIMQWQYVVMDTNDSIEEINKAKEIAKSLDCEIFFKKTWEKDYEPSNPEEIQKATGLDFSDDNNIYKGSNRFLPCKDLWSFPYINYDGRLFACCCNANDLFDINVFEVGLEKALNDYRVKKTRKMLMGGKKYEESPCYKCELFWKMVKDNNFIKKDELK